MKKFKVEEFQIHDWVWTFDPHFKGQQNMIPIKYVHQLQQGIRMVGLINEANKFKIEKSHEQ